MKTHLKLIAGLALAAISSASAQQDATHPVGFRTETLVGNGAFNLLSANLTEPISAGGTATAVAGAVITDDAADFTTSLAGEDITWLFQATSGDAMGTVSEVASVDSATQVTLADDISQVGFAVGDSYEIRASATISSIFGPANEAGLKGGEANTSDHIWVPDGNGGFNVYYFQDNFLGKEWVSLGGQPGANVPIAYTDGFYVRRVDPNPLDIVLVGHVQVRGTTVPLINGFNFIANPAPVGQTFATTGLETSIFGENADNSDLIWNPDGNGGYSLIYYQNNFLGEGWFTLGGQDAKDTAVQSAVIIERKGDPTNADFGQPPFYADL